MYGKKVTVLFCLICCFSSLHKLVGQQITWGEDPRKNSKNNYFMSLGENQNGVFVLSHSSRNNEIYRFSIEQYSHQLFFAKSKQVRLRNQLLERIQVLENNVFFAASPDKVKKGNFPLNAFLLNEELDEYLVQKQLLNIEITSNHQSSYYIVRSDPFKKTVGAFGFLVNEKTKETTLYVALFNEKLEPIYNHTHQLNRLVTEAQVSDIFIDKYANYYLLYTHEKRETKIGDGRHEDVLLSYNWESNQLKSQPLLHHTVRIKESGFALDAILDKVVISGLYGQESNENQEGLFHVLIESKSSEVLSETQSLFANFIPLQDKQGNTAPKGIETLTNFEVKKVIRATDNRTIVIAEKYYTDIVYDQYWANGVPVSFNKNAYNYDELMIFAIDSLGAISWTQTIMKKQRTEGDFGYFSSVLIGVMPRFISLIFNDNHGSSKDIIAYNVSLNGEVSNQLLLPRGTNGSYIIPVEGRQIGYNRLLVPVAKKGEYQLLKITFND